MDKLISIADYAAKHGVDAASVRQKILRGNLPEAFKIGRNYVIPENAEYCDNRRNKLNY